MNGNATRFIQTSLVLVDLLVINLAFVISYLIKFGSFDRLGTDRYLVLFGVYNLAWLIATYLFSAYRENKVIDFDNYLIKVIRICLVQVLLITAFWVARKAFYYSREQLLWTFGLLFGLMFLWRGIFFFLVKRFRKSGRYLKKVVLVGSGELVAQLQGIFERNRDYGFDIIRVFNTKSDEGVEGLREIESLLATDGIDEMYCALDELSAQQVQRLSALADSSITRLRLVPDIRGVNASRMNIDFFEHLPVLSVRTIPLDDTFNRLIKRGFDILFSLLVIVFVLSWLMPILAILIKTGSKGPVLFRQLRSGKDNEEFPCLKFRSMTVNQDADSLQASKHDARITGIGHFMRRTSIDELPQFFNVLVGQMSVVGPRPHMIKHTEEYSQLIGQYMVRHFVKPGITGLAQIKGYRGETREKGAMEGRIRMDKLYVESWTFLLDIWIVFRTVLNVFKKEDKAY